MSNANEGKDASHVGEAWQQSELPAEKAGTSVDKSDMYRMGKMQEFRRNFHFISIFGFTAVLMITWEGMFNAVSYSLPNGGLPDLIWMYLVTLIGFGAAILSMAEMASMAPTSVSISYPWSSVAAYRAEAYSDSRNRAGNITGSQSLHLRQLNESAVTLQAGIAGQCFTVALQIQGLIILNDSNYNPQAWHAVLLMIATVGVGALFNTFFARQLPLIEATILVFHICGFFAILVPLWIFAPKHTNAQVWKDFQVTSGWSSVGLAVLVGNTGPLYALMGSDAAVHMSEEVHDSSRNVPWAMVWTLILNGTTGFVMTVTFAYCLGPLSAAVAPEYNFAFIGTFYNATQSHAGTTVMTCIITLLTFCSALSNLATASRQFFAFARDGGLPFSNVWRQVRWDLPLNALIFSLIFTSLLSLINLGSITAFNAVLSIGVVALLSSYLIVIACILLKRIRGEELLPRRWSLGTPFGYFCNILGLAYLILAFIFAFFPIGVPVDAETMNWAIAVYGGVGILSVVYYFLYARRTYVPPVARLAKEQ